MGNEFNGWDIVITGMSIILIMGVLPAMICFSFKYTVNLDHIVLQKRYSRIVFYEIIIFVIKLLFSSSVFISLVIEQQHDVNSTPLTISMIGANMSSYLLYLTWVLRFYMLMYDMSWITAAKADHWQHVINPTYKNTTTNWFLTHKKTYGNLRYVFWHYFVPLLIIGIPTQNVFYFLQLKKFKYHSDFAHDFTRILDYAITLIPFILLIIIYCRIPSFQDKFFIHAELHRILTCISVQYVSFFVTVTIHLLPTKSHLWTLTYFISVVCEFAAMSIATIWVASKVESIIHSQLYHIRKFESKSRNEYVSIDSPRHEYVSTTIDTKSQSHLLMYQQGRTKTRSPTKDCYTLEQLLNSKQSFELFMVQLGHEFSQEILLSFIEFIQFQQLIAQYISINNLGIGQLRHTSINQAQYGNQFNPYQGREYYEFIHFPNNVPKSYIIYGAYRKNSHSLEEDIGSHINEIEFIERLKIITWKIHEKYVINNSPFQINIPYTTQRQIQKVIVNEKTWSNNTDIQLPQFLHIFDDAIYEVYSLMMDSYRRFRKTQRYLGLQLSVESNQ
eukprot:416615_1